MNVDELVAIDFHTHAMASARSGRVAVADPEKMAKYFGIEDENWPTVTDVASFYRERNMACVMFTVDSLAQHGDEPAISNDELFQLAAEESDVVIPFASIDPARGEAAVEEARRLLGTYPVRGFKFHPNEQGFFPNDEAVYPFYEVIQEAGVPALFHTGQTGVGAGRPGGGGVRLKYSNPIYLDDVAADFPDLTIVLAHPSFPWQDEALAVATHKPRVYIDLSGWSPKYFPPQLVKYADSLLKNKVLFGTDYPLITPDRWLRDFEELPIRDENRVKILKENAVRLLGLDQGS